MFEYKSVTLTKNEGKEFNQFLNEELNKYGDEGWKLVKMEVFPKKDGILMFEGTEMTAYFLLVFKRKRD